LRRRDGSKPRGEFACSIVTHQKIEAINLTMSGNKPVEQEKPIKSYRLTNRHFDSRHFVEKKTNAISYLEFSLISLKKKNQATKPITLWEFARTKWL